MQRVLGVVAEARLELCARRIALRAPGLEVVPVLERRIEGSLRIGVGEAHAPVGPAGAEVRRVRRPGGWLRDPAPVALEARLLLLRVPEEALARAAREEQRSLRAQTLPEFVAVQDARRLGPEHLEDVRIAREREARELRQRVDDVVAARALPLLEVREPEKVALLGDADAARVLVALRRLEPLGARPRL